jgi:predicted phage-related endonuclease
MRWGIEKEPEAREAYAYPRNANLTPVAFVNHPTIAMSGASPDCYVGDDGLIEVKCPNTATHIDTLLGKSVPGKYVLQMQWQMACTGRKWCDFVSFDPRMPEHLRLFVRRLNRDDVEIATLEKQVIEFLDEIDATVKALSALDLAA